MLRLKIVNIILMAQKCLYLVQEFLKFAYLNVVAAPLSTMWQDILRHML